MLRHRSLADAPHAYGSTLELERDWDLEVYATRLAERNSVLAFSWGAPAGIGAGFCDRPGWFHLVSIWVDPRVRGRGLNALILQELIGRANELGLRVHLDVVEGNDTARRSYERFGFTGTGERFPLREGSDRLCERLVLPVGPLRRG